MKSGKPARMRSLFAQIARFAPSETRREEASALAEGIGGGETTDAASQSRLMKSWRMYQNNRATLAKSESDAETY